MLSCFSLQRPSLTLSEFAQELGLHKSVVHRLAATLEDAGFLERPDDGPAYSIGPRAYELGMLFLRNTEVEARGRRVIEALRDRTGLTAQIAIWSRDGALVVDSAESPQPIRIAGGVGARLPAHASSAGKLLLAMQPPEVVGRVIARGLAPLTPTTIVDPDALRAHLAEVRAQGHALNLEEFYPGIVGIAVPLPGYRGRDACVVLAGPSPLMPPDLSELIETVRQAAEQFGPAEPPGRPNGEV